MQKCTFCNIFPEKAAPLVDTFTVFYLAVVKSQFRSDVFNLKFDLYQEKETTEECATAEEPVYPHQRLPKKYAG